MTMICHLVSRKSVVFLLIGIVFIFCQKEKEGVDHPPRIDLVKINPDVIHALDKVILNPVVSDPDGDKVRLTYNWERNGLPLSKVKSSTLSVELTKGDRIEVELIPSDGKLKGKPYKVGPLVVKNTPPKIIDYDLTPLILRTDTTLTLTVKTEDVDGDRVEVTVDWEINGKIVERLKNRDKLTPGDYKRGDVISCNVTASDGEDSYEMRSIEIEAKNGPPQFTGFKSYYRNGKAYLKITGKDPDQDSISLSLISGPEGVTIDQRNLQLNWDVSGQPGTTYTDTLLLKLSDPYGGSAEIKVPITIRF